MGVRIVPVVIQAEFPATIVVEVPVLVEKERTG